MQRVLRAVPARSVAQRAAGLDVLVRALAAAGECERATEALREFETIAATVGTLPLRAASRALAGIVAAAATDEAGARSHLEDAIGLFERCHAPYEAAATRVLLADVLLRQGRTERSAQEAGAALRVLEALGALGDVTRARALLDRRDPGAHGSRNVLTDRQVEIIRLVAQGMSDREIAAALVMSEHTVHRHVANILQRLEQSSRAAAVAQASRLGLL